MKTRSLVSILILVLALLIVVGSCATGKKAYVAKEDEELFGTWINPDYDASWIHAKIVVKPDGTWSEYKMSYDDKPLLKGEYTINDKWTDSDGYNFYKIILTAHYMPYYILSKIDKTGNVYEDLWSTVEMPSEFDPDNKLYIYRIYYRQ
jgi:hypothetical protein